MTDEAPKLLVKVYREDLVRVMQRLQDELNKMFLYKPLTSATKERMKWVIADFMKQMGRGEKNPVWQIQFEIVQNSVSTFTLEPNLDGIELINRSPLAPPHIV